MNAQQQHLYSWTRRRHSHHRSHPSHPSHPKAHPLVHRRPLLSQATKPGSNFYLHVNKDWIEKTSIPEYEATFSVSEEVENHIHTQIEEIIKDAIQYTEKNPLHDGGIAAHPLTLIGTLWKSAKATRKLGEAEESLKYLKKLLSSFSCIRDTQDVMRILAELCVSNIPNILDVRITIHKETSSKYMFTIEPDFPGLNYHYYDTKIPHNTKVLKEYELLCKKLGGIFELDGLEQTIHLETSLVENYINEVNDDLICVKGSILRDKFPGIPWGIFFKTLGFPQWETTPLLLRSMGWIRILSRLLKTLSLETWKLFFCKQILLEMIPHLPEKYSCHYFSFFGNKLQGKKTPLPESLQIESLLTHVCQDEISQLYSKKYVKSKTIEKSREIANTILKSAKRRLSETEWLKPSTRRKAIEKIQAIGCGIAVPSRWKEFEPVEHLTENNLIQNLIFLKKREYSTMVKMLGKEPCCWQEGVFQVNAFYFSETNELIVPAGTIQPPFFSIQASDGWNYGGYGAILGHELIHAFDSDGKEYDPDGKQTAWWTPADNAAFTRKIKTLIELFNSTRLHGKSVNGYMTVNENIADLGGLAVALDSLKTVLEKKGVSEKEKKEEYRDFFISYAVSWRTLLRPQKLEQMLLLDVHSPPELRVNLIVSHFQEWYDSFDIQESDALYIHPEKRIRIF